MADAFLPENLGGAHRGLHGDPRSGTGDAARTQHGPKQRGGWRTSEHFVSRCKAGALDPAAENVRRPAIVPGIRAAPFPRAARRLRQIAAREGRGVALCFRLKG